MMNKRRSSKQLWLRRCSVISLPCKTSLKWGPVGLGAALKWPLYPCVSCTVVVSVGVFSKFYMCVYLLLGCMVCLCVGRRPSLLSAPHFRSIWSFIGLYGPLPFSSSSLVQNQRALSSSSIYSFKTCVNHFYF